MTGKRYSLGRFGCYRTRIVIDNKNGHELGNSIVIERLNALHEENEQLKKSIECQNEMIKEQCMKIDWASECGVKWDKEFKEWSGVE